MYVGKYALANLWSINCNSPPNTPKRKSWVGRLFKRASTQHAFSDAPFRHVHTGTDLRVLLLISRCAELDRTYCCVVFHVSAYIKTAWFIILLLSICRPSGCRPTSGVVVVVVGGGVCNRSQMRTSKCTRLIFGVSIGLEPG